MDKVAILVDGGYYKSCFRSMNKRKPKPSEFYAHCEKLLTDEKLKDYQLLRIYYYDCLPFEGESKHPMSGKRIKYSDTPIYKDNIDFINDLSLMPNITVRTGSLSMIGWKLDNSTLNKVINENRKVLEGDIQPDFKQKGIDMIMGLDIAKFSTKKLVDCIVLLTGDSDLIPALEFAKEEGLRIVTNIMDNQIHAKLKGASDHVIIFNK